MTVMFKPIEVTPSFYQLGTPFFPVYLSIGERAMLIEGGVGATFEIIVSQLKSLNIAPERIACVALTHSHGDHVGAFPRMKALWPHLKILASQKAADVMAGESFRKEFQWLEGKVSKIMMGNGFIGALPAKIEDIGFGVDRIVREGDRIDLGNGVQWTVHEVPGHAPCMVAYHEEREGTLAIGDATGFYSPEKDAMWPNYFMSLEVYCGSIRKLDGLDARRLALSHNGIIKDPREFLKKALAVTGAYHREMLERVARGEDPEAISLEKAQWVREIASEMPFEVMTHLTRLLIELSRKAGEKPDAYFRLAS